MAPLAGGSGMPELCYGILQLALARR